MTGSQTIATDWLGERSRRERPDPDEQPLSSEVVALRRCIALEEETQHPRPDCEG